MRVQPNLEIKVRFLIDFKLLLNLSWSIPGFTSDFSMKGELKDTFLATESISEEDVKILASKFSCMVESDSFTKLVSWSDLLAGKFNGDLVRADADCINTLPDP